MTDDELDRAYDKYDEAWRNVHNLVDAILKDETDEVSYFVLRKLSEEFRFWERNYK